jgi:DNA-directed RNA polymerase subunit RPC12/RpoP
MGEPKTAETRRATCQRCGSSDVAWILRGCPAMDEKLQAELRAHRVTLGGCIVWEGQPDHRCNTCGLEFRADGRPVRTPGDDR